MLFSRGSKRSGFKSRSEDVWDVVWETPPEWTEVKIRNEQKTAFGEAVVVTNPNPVSKKTVWVVGDSFTNLLKDYFNANFKQVHYLGHWEHKFSELPSLLEAAKEKPDFIFIVRVERSF